MLGKVTSKQCNCAHPFPKCFLRDRQNGLKIFTYRTTSLPQEDRSASTHIHNVRNKVSTLVGRCASYTPSIGGSGWGAAGARPPPPPNRINFFRFRIRFRRKVYMSEVGAPPPPPTENPGSATAQYLCFGHYY